MLLLRPFWLFLVVRLCQCGQPLDSCGLHRAACAQAGVLGRRGWALDSVVARVCREAGGRVTTNVMLRDFNMALPDVADGRRLEVVVDELPLFGGVQLAIDTTLVCETLTSCGGRRCCTQASSPTERKLAPGGSFFLWWAGDGLRKRGTSYPNICCGSVPNRLGVSDGVQCSPAQLQELWPPACWSCLVPVRCDGSFASGLAKRVWLLVSATAVASLQIFRAMSVFLGHFEHVASDGEYAKNRLKRS